LSYAYDRIGRNAATLSINAKQVEFEMSASIFRHIAMLSLIPARPRKISARELHAKLERQGFRADIRSTERDLHKLSSRFALVSDDARPAGWSWFDRDTSFSIPPMNSESALTYELLSRYLAPMLPKSMLDAMAPEFAQARRTLSDLHQAPLGRWSKRVAVLPFGHQLLPPEVDTDVVAAVNEALLSSRQFEANYRPMGEKKAKRYLFNPLGLVYQENVFYLVASLWDYPDARHFALQRMSNTEVLSSPAAVIKGFDFERYIHEEKAFEFPQRNRIKLELNVDGWLARLLEERRLSTDQKIRPVADGESFRVTATLQDTEQLFWWLRSLGTSLEVLKPVSLRKKMAETALALSEIYR